MRRPPGRQRHEVGQRQASALGVEGAGGQLAAQGRCHLQVGGQGHALAAQPGARLVAVGPVTGSATRPKATGAAGPTY